MAGKKVTQAGDQLHLITLQRLYEGITATSGIIFDLVDQLRTLKSIDPDAYRRTKTMLPYVVCAVFVPPVRRKENFAYTQCFMVDIDKLSQAGMTTDGVKRLLEKDERIAMLFVSPGNDGVKALFLLKEKIHDAGYYSHFYKAFTAAFAAQYQLQQVVDFVTSDVSRCCFMSHDAEAFFRPAAAPVDASAYLNVASTMPKAVELTEKPAPDGEVEKVPTHPKPEKQELPDDVLRKIKELLDEAKGKRPLPPKPVPVQPEALQALVEGLGDALAQIGIKLAAATPIQFGKQLKVTAGHNWAELNLYYGKKGFTVVKTTKTGSNNELAALAKEATEWYIAQQVNL